MKLYHGTNIAFDKVDLIKSRLGKDFGAVFYLTPDFAVAQRQAERKFEQNGVGHPVVLQFDWDEENFKKLKIKEFDSYSLEWAEFILSNRSNKTNVPIHEYDIVIGPIADDTVGFQIRRYEDGVISIEQFLEEIKFHRVTIQYFFGTERATDTLKKI